MVALGNVCGRVGPRSNVRFGSKADICSAIRHVRFTPKSGHVQCKEGCPLCANSGHCALFDHLVGAREHRVRHTDSEHLSGLLIDDQLDFGCLHYW